MTETITPQELRHAHAEAARTQSNDPLVGLLPDESDMPRECDDPFDRWNEWDWASYVEPDSEY